MITNQIYVPTRGTDPKKYFKIEEFEKITGKEYSKVVVSSFRMAGKVSDFVKAHALAAISRDYNYNGYGYQDHHYLYLMKERDAKTVVEMIEAKKAKPTMTKEEKTQKWAKRLAKLTGITVEQALELADEKTAYQKERISMLEDRQELRHSVRRKKLINKIHRENPLRRIEDEQHARSILEASVRHNHSDYEYLLEEGREKAGMGEIGRDEVKEYARSHARSRVNVEDVFFGHDKENSDEE